MNSVGSFVAWVGRFIGWKKFVAGVVALAAIVNWSVVLACLLGLAVIGAVVVVHVFQGVMANKYCLKWTRTEGFSLMPPVPPPSARQLPP